MRDSKEIMRNPFLTVEAGGSKFGFGVIQIPDRCRMSVVWGTDEDGLEHVSVSPFDHSITPSWDDMCIVKDVFWRDDELVVQIHPPKAEYVNMMPNCLHLWRDKAGQIDEVLKGRMMK